MCEIISKIDLYLGESDKKFDLKIKQNDQGEFYITDIDEYYIWVPREEDLTHKRYFESESDWIGVTFKDKKSAIKEFNKAQGLIS